VPRTQPKTKKRLIVACCAAIGAAALGVSAAGAASATADTTKSVTGPTFKDALADGKMQCIAAGYEDGYDIDSHQNDDGSWTVTVVCH
jgi:hypothetical protein